MIRSSSTRTATPSLAAFLEIGDPEEDFRKLRSISLHPQRIHLQPAGLESTSRYFGAPKTTSVGKQVTVPEQSIQPHGLFERWLSLNDSENENPPGRAGFLWSLRMDARYLLNHAAYFVRFRVCLCIG